MDNEHDDFKFRNLNERLIPLDAEVPHRNFYITDILSIGGWICFIISVICILISWMSL